MVGLVLVSHSAALAGALKELVLAMSSGPVPIAVAAGIDNEQAFGTDALSIRQAIESVFSKDGVLVLMDLGSAILSAETALEFIPESMKEKIRLCPAPLVEAAVVAAIQAQAGSDLDRVEAEARNALAAKENHLPGEPAVEPQPADGPGIGGGGSHREGLRLRVPNRLGIHARPAAKLVTLVSLFDAEVYAKNVTLDSRWVPAGSINQVATLDVQQGHELALSAEGSQSVQVLKALSELIRDGFGEQDAAEGDKVSRSKGGTYQGQSASPGFALAPSAIYRLEIPQFPRLRAEDVQAEWRRLDQGITLIREKVSILQKQLALRGGKSESAIFDAHLLYLKDPLLIEDARQSIENQRTSAESAWQNAVNRIIDRYARLTEPYLRERAADLADVRDQVLRALIGVTDGALVLSQKSILIAPELGPAEILQLDAQQILGFCTALGGATSHSAILARSLGIPAVVGLGSGILNCGGRQLALNGSSGEVWIDPCREKRQEIQKKRNSWLKKRRREQQSGQRAARTRDGRLLQVKANIIGATDARFALECGADGIGVMRTEFLYLQRTAAPDEEEQFRIYSAIAAAMEQRPLTIRTLDIGGDKPLPYLRIHSSANPLLGQRGVRVYTDHPDLLKAQLRAVLRTSPGHHIGILLPMISCCDEIRFVKSILKQAREELRAEGKKTDRSVKLGIMIELPSAVALADQLAGESDFFSIGTNDLSQYTLAVDRSDPRISGKYDSFHPAVLRQIRDTVLAGHKAGIPVGVCGEMAGIIEAVPLLVGLELDMLSMTPVSIPAVKKKISELRFEKAKKRALEVLDLDSAQAVYTVLTAGGFS